MKTFSIDDKNFETNQTDAVAVFHHVGSHPFLGWKTYHFWKGMSWHGSGTEDWIGRNRPEGSSFARGEDLASTSLVNVHPVDKVPVWIRSISLHLHLR